MVKFNKEGIEFIRNKIDSEELKTIGRLNKTSFIKERKMGFTKLMKYILNKRGLTTSMEINNFYNDISEEGNITNQSLLDQRLKLNPEVFIESWYNNKRIHSTLGYITSNQKYNDYITNLVVA